MPTNAFIVERSDGTIAAYNCRVKKAGDRLTVIPDEKQITRLHCNMKHSYTVSFCGKSKQVEGGRADWLFGMEVAEETS